MGGLLQRVGDERVERVERDGRSSRVDENRFGRHEETLGAAIIARTRSGFRDPQGGTLDDARLEYEVELGKLQQ